ncbi:MAG TPA: hypothetical protein VG435_15470 [Acidimicrobiales bacterium]|jgi:hypothetical protein|nr:hypothetical protein [Acidimicrobiales bacterium]
MTTPVLISARNEGEHIGVTLKHLPAGTRPVVIANGCDEDDRTVEVARGMGAEVIEMADAGKMQAVQAGIRRLGPAAIEPFVTIDADTRPLSPRLWLSGLRAGRRRVDAERPAVIVGPSIFIRHGLPMPVRTTWYNLKQYRSRRDVQRGEFRGLNMLVHAQNAAMVERILDLPPFWPGEDLAVARLIERNGGHAFKTIDPRAAVVTDGSRVPSAWEVVRRGNVATKSVEMASYLHDAPLGSIPFVDDSQLD